MRRERPWKLLTIALAAAACSSMDDGAERGRGGASGGSQGASSSATGGTTSASTTASSSASSSASSAGGAGGDASSGGPSTGGGGVAIGTGGASGAGGSGGRGGAGGTPSSDAGTPPGFWDTNCPAATKVMTFKFLNRTNGKFTDAQIYWSFQIGSLGIDELHSFAEAPTYDMPANGSGRMYFYIVTSPADPPESATAPRRSRYNDFIEHTIGATRYNGNTTRVDAFGLKIAMRLRCADGYDVAVGEDYETFAEDRAVTFQKFVDEVPAEWKHLGQVEAPYRIPQPGSSKSEFRAGGPNANYYAAWIDELWSVNGLTIPKAGPNCSGLGAYPAVSAACERHVGGIAGTFSADGKLRVNTLWQNAATFYTKAPADYYAKFMHDHAIDKKAYGFPYDDVGGWSSYVSHDNPRCLIIAVGW
jgi:hypothetical protein